MISFVVIAAILGVAFGFFLARASERRRSAEAVDAAVERGRSSAAVDIATLRERVRGYDEEREQLNQERAGLKSALETAGVEKAQHSERASRVPALDALVASLHEQQKSDRQEILRLSTSEAEKSQSFQDVSDRLVDVEKAFSDSDRELAGTRQQSALMREESGRLNAEIKAERDVIASLRCDLNEEKSQREKGGALSGKLADDLAESNKRRAVFEVEALRVPALEAHVVTLLEQQNADRQEILRLATSEAEKIQAFQDVSVRFADVERALPTAILS